LHSSSKYVQQFDSGIISSIPSIFNHFGKKSYRFSYHGSRDGFDSRHFHDKINGHSQTITIGGYLGGYLGGYMVCEWDSSDSWKIDESQQSFLFTVKNPHNMPARKFPLKYDKKHLFLYCGATSALTYFGTYGAITIYPDCNATLIIMDLVIHEGAMRRALGLTTKTFFTGVSKLTMKELEIHIRKLSCLIHSLLTRQYTASFPHGVR
jgi:hypothetical protein